MSVQGAPVGYTNGTSFKWNTKGQIIAAATILPAVGLICVGMRFWARFHRRAGFGLDDAFVVPALVCPLFAIIPRENTNNAYTLQISFALLQWASRCFLVTYMLCFETVCQST